MGAEDLPETTITQAVAEVAGAVHLGAEEEMEIQVQISQQMDWPEAVVEAEELQAGVVDGAGIIQHHHKQTPDVEDMDTGQEEVEGGIYTPNMDWVAAEVAEAFHRPN